MKVGELWLRTVVDPPISTEQLVDQLTHAGIEIDALEKKEGHLHPIITFKVPANRSDCLSVEGLGREIAILNQLPFKTIEVANTFPKISITLPVRVQVPAACPRYLSRIIQNINPTAEVPAWIQNRLEESGIRSISPVVDVTNYVMLELGQPLHVFDICKLEAELVVRFAKENERMTTLEGKEVELDVETLVIADSKKPVAIAGVIGGMSAAVDSTTRNIVLESAYFDPIRIRRVSKNLHLRTESSYRFERGIDPNLQARALARATELLLEIVGGNPSITQEQMDTRYLPKASTLLLRTTKVEDILGIELAPQKIQSILTALGMHCVLQGNHFEVEVPSFRVDITREVDLIEEIARIYGFHNIPTADPWVTFDFMPMAETEALEHRFKQVLVDRGYYEAITYSFVEPSLQNGFFADECALRLKNPISEELSVMRSSLWPGLMKALHYNQCRHQSHIRLFEMGVCFLGNSDSLEQQNRLAGICGGPVQTEQWGTVSRAVDFYDVKGDVQALLALTRRSDFKFEVATHPALHPGQTAKIMDGTKILGYIGALHPRITKALDIQGSIFAFELEVDGLKYVKIPTFRELSKYPIIRRDIAVIVDNAVLVTDLKSAIVESIGILAVGVVIFDVYRGRGVRPDGKSVALGLILQHPSRTLTEVDVNESMQKAIQALKQRYQAILRE